MEEYKNGNRTLIIAIATIIIALLVRFGYILVKDNNNENTNINTTNTKKTYEEFKKEYNSIDFEDYGITENNFEYHEDELFSKKYSDLIENKIDIYRNGSRCLITTKNTTDEFIGQASTYVIFYDEDGKIIDIESFYIYDLEEGGIHVTDLYSFPNEFDKVAFYNKLEPEKELPSLRQSNIETELVISDDKKQVKFTNRNNESCSSISGYIVFYDEEGKVIDSNGIYISDKLKSNATTFDEIYITVDSWDSYEIIINNVR